jgi:hypothetical protein
MAWSNIKEIVEAKQARKQRMCHACARTAVSPARWDKGERNCAACEEDAAQRRKRKSPRRWGARRDE